MNEYAHMDDPREAAAHKVQGACHGRIWATRSGRKYIGDIGEYRSIVTHG